MPKSSEPGQQSGLDPATSRTLAALLGSESVPAAAAGDAIRRLSVLVEVADNARHLGAAGKRLLYRRPRSQTEEVGTP